MAPLFQLSEAASLALHSLALVAAQAPGPVSVRLLAEQTGASDNHLAKVLQRLTKAGLVKAVRGPSGGYLLARHAAGITLLEVYEAIEGQVSSGPCPCARGFCAFRSCLFEGVFAQVNRQLLEYLSTHTLERFSPESAGTP